jgi:hypothetical protein
VKRTAFLCLLCAAAALAVGYALPRSGPRKEADAPGDVKAAESRLRDCYVEGVTTLDARARNAHLAGDDGPAGTLDADRAACYRRYRDSVRAVYEADGREPPVWTTLGGQGGQQ